MKIGTIELLAFSKLPGVGSSTVREMVVSNLDLNELRKYEKDKAIKLFKGSKKEEAYIEFQENFSHYVDQAQYELDRYSANDIQVVSFMDEKYPKLYRLLNDFPIFLYAKGNLKLLNHNYNIAVIGTRDNTNNGARIAKNTTTFFAENGYNIVSGLAKGIDCIAHQAALDAKGFTTAVLTDLQKIYPKENRSLADRILDGGGLLIAEYPPGTPTQRSFFVERDRLQSGLSLAVFPIETDITGGTMHTVGFAQHQNRLIFCPDLRREKTNIDEYPKSRGVIELIKTEKARPYTREDYPAILELLDKKALELGKDEFKHLSSHKKPIDSEGSRLKISTNSNTAEKQTPSKEKANKPQNLEFLFVDSNSNNEDNLLSEQSSDLADVEEKLLAEISSLSERLGSAIEQLRQIRNNSKKQTTINLKL